MTGSGTAAGSTPTVIDYESGGGRGGGSRDRLAQDQRTKRPADCAAFLAGIATAGDSHAPNYRGDTQEITTNSPYLDVPSRNLAITGLITVSRGAGRRRIRAHCRRHQGEGGFMSPE